MCSSYHWRWQTPSHINFRKFEAGSMCTKSHHNVWKQKHVHSYIWLHISMVHQPLDDIPLSHVGWLITRVVITLHSYFLFQPMIFPKLHDQNSNKRKGKNNQKRRREAVSIESRRLHWITAHQQTWSAQSWKSLCVVVIMLYTWQL